MNQVWIIAGNDLRVFLKEKAGYVCLFVMPLVFIYFFGIAMKGNDRSPSSPQPSLIVHNQHEGYMGGLFVELLNAEGFQTVLATQTQPDERSLAIPKNFTKRVTEADSVELDFRPGQSSAQEPAAMLEVRVTRAVVAMTSAVFSLVSAESAAGLSEARLKDALLRERMVSLDVEFAGRRRVPSGFAQSVPGTS